MAGRHADPDGSIVAPSSALPRRNDHPTWRQRAMFRLSLPAIAERPGSHQERLPALLVLLWPGAPREPAGSVPENHKARPWARILGRIPETGATQVTTPSSLREAAVASAIGRCSDFGCPNHPGCAQARCGRCPSPCQERSRLDGSIPPGRQSSPGRKVKRFNPGCRLLIGRYGVCC